MGQAEAKPAAEVKRVVTAEEVAKHKHKNDCWIIIQGMVCDVSAFMEDHPGGTTVLLDEAGGDATEMFEGIHSDKAKKEMQKYIIAKLGAAAPAPAPAAAPAPAPAAAKVDL